MKKIAAGLMMVALVIGGLFLYRAYLIQEYRAPLLTRLKDPDSAKFRHEVFVGPWGLEPGVLCGQVNAKNALGGYVGYKFFDAYTDSDDKKMKANLYESEGDSVCDLMKNGVPWWWLHW